MKPGAIPSRHALHLCLFIRKCLKNYKNYSLKAKIIERVEASEWISSVVVARHKNGKIRLCVDLYGPNSQIISEVHLLPAITELQARMNGSVFSQIDLKSAYHQLVLEPTSHHITAFIKYDGLFQFTIVPFLLVSAGAAFQRFLGSILNDIPGVEHYLNDLFFVQEVTQKSMISD